MPVSLAYPGNVALAEARQYNPSLSARVAGPGCVLRSVGLCSALDVMHGPHCHAATC